MFAYKCSFCGFHKPGDFTPSVICKIDDRYVQGTYSPYNLTKQGLYYAKIRLSDGRVALHKTDSELLSCLPGIEASSYLTTEEIYCNGPIETSDDDYKIQNHRYCRPSIS